MAQRQKSGNRRGALPGVFLGVFLGALLAVMVVGIQPLCAHPHVFVTAVSELIYAPDGSVTGVRHAWTFDDMFSSYALQGIESKTRAYTREELAPLAQVNVDSLKEYGFFTFAKADGRRERFQEPIDYFLEYRDGTLTLHFTLMLKNPVKPKQLVLEVYDRSFFVEFQMAKADPVKLRDAPAGCQMKLERPGGGGAAVARTLNEQTFIDDGENANFGASYANRITVDCP